MGNSFLEYASTTPFLWRTRVRQIGLIRGIHVASGRRRYRSRIQIAADILEIAMNGSRKTRIMYLGNLSFDLLQKYLDMLTSYDLIELRRDSDKSYITTEKGRHFLEDYRELQEYSEMVELKRRVLETSLAVRA